METLQFNAPVRERYEANRYFGRNIDNMPKLLADGRIPMSISDFMQLRLFALDLYAGTLEHPKKFTRDQIKRTAAFFKDVYSTYVDAGDSVLYHPDGKIKINLVDETGRDTEFLK